MYDFFIWGTSFRDVQDGDNDSGCFIASAAYGSPVEPHVKLLREFRDNFLLNNYVRQAFIDLYYRCSPPLANFIAGHDALKSVVRWVIVPVVGMGYVALKLGIVPMIAAIFFFGIGIIGFARYGRKFGKS
jgi:hypothetical protein